MKSTKKSSDFNHEKYNPLVYEKNNKLKKQEAEFLETQKISDHEDFLKKLETNSEKVLRITLY